MKIKLLKIFTLFVLLVLIYFSVQGKKEKGSYYKYISQKKFFQRLRHPPHWMDEQIEKDFNSLDGIRQKALEETYCMIREKLSRNKQNFIRFRVFNNKIYMYLPDEEKYSKKETAFEKAIRTLTKIVRLPDLDFIYSDQDGTPLSFSPKDFYLAKNKDGQAYVFSRAKNRNAEFVILIPDYHSLSCDWARDYRNILNKNKEMAWANKKNIIFWRGNPHTNQRLGLCEISLKNPKIVDAGFVDNNYNDQNFIKNFVLMEDHLQYKYLPVLDGFMCSYAGFQWRLLSNSLVFKQNSDEIQWFYSALKPYVHYVPIENDMSDLLEKYNWAIQNDEKCKKIAANATEFVINNLSLEDIYVYLYKVLIKYSKKQDFSSKDLRKSIKNNVRWICIQNRKKSNKKYLKEKL